MKWVWIIIIIKPLLGLMELLFSGNDDLPDTKSQKVYPFQDWIEIPLTNIALWGIIKV